MMPKPATSVRLDMAFIHASSVHSHGSHAFDSPSPYPPSSPSTDSSDAEDLPRISKTSLRYSIAELPESKLRSILFKLAGSSPRFEHAIRKELALAQSSGDSPPMTPTTSKPRKASRKQSHQEFGDVEVATPEHLAQQGRTGSPSLTRIQEDFVYHPGYLNQEVYEFLPHATQRDVTFTDMRTLTMWSCCDEDERSPGCMLLSPYTDLSNQDQHGQILGEPLHVDVFPDSDLER
ncbi:hypothetical protein BJ912DRAFT_663547 [Pholiota molesta]|nr:hypothetical protein BJ912DRAFT_663547 [Pholiota molesta]